MTLRIIYELSQFHSSVAGNIERRTVSERNVDRASDPGFDHIATIDQIPDLHLIGCTGGRIGLNQNGGWVFDADDAACGYDLPDGARVKTRGRLRGITLAPSQSW
jgi:hypothetical protein